MIKHCVLIFLFLLFFPLGLLSQSGDEVHYQPPFLPFNADVMGMGGAFTASSRGFSSLFYNPAGFAMGDYSLTFVSINPWIYTDPFTLFGLQGMSEDEEIDRITGQVLSGGYGNGLQAGIGFVKSGLGLGASFIMDSYINSSGDINEIEGNVHMTLGFILGYAYSFTFSDFLISIGGDVRPMARVFVPVSGSLAQDVFNAYNGSGEEDLFVLLADADSLHGLGIGFDAGIIAQYKEFKYGISVRDIGGTQFDFRENIFSDVIDSLANNRLFPEDGTKPDGVYRIPMNVSTGISYHPDLGGLSRTIDPQVHLDFQDIINVIIEEKDVLLLLHLGVEATLFDIVTIRGGFSQGHFSAGLGLNILFLDLNLAYFTKENGDFSGNIPAGCSVVEFAVRMRL